MILSSKSREKHITPKSKTIAKTNTLFFNSNLKKKKKDAINAQKLTLISCHVGSFTGGLVSSLMGSLVSEKILTETASWNELFWVTSSILSKFCPGPNNPKFNKNLFALYSIFIQTLWCEAWSLSSFIISAKSTLDLGTHPCFSKDSTEPIYIDLWCCSWNISAWVPCLK